MRKKKPTKQVTLHFTNDQIAILEWMACRAKENFRSVEQEILFVLSKSSSIYQHIDDIVAYKQDMYMSQCDSDIDDEELKVMEKDIAQYDCSSEGDAFVSDTAKENN